MATGAVQPSWTRTLLRALWLATVLGVAIDLALLASRLGGPSLGYPGEPWSSVAFDVGDLLFASIGVLLVARQPRNVIGWILLSEGLVQGLSEPASHIGLIWLAADPSSTRGAVALLLADGLQQVSIGLGAIYLPLLFPDGRFLGPRWRTAGIAAGVALALGALGSSLIPGPIGSHRVINPIGLSAFPFVADLLYSIGSVVTIAAVVAAAASVVVRYRRSDPEVRQQLRWFASVAVAVAVGLVLFYSQWDPMTGGLNVVGALGLGLGLLGYMGVPVAVGVAVIHYRLYRIDVLLNRTLVYVPLIAIVAGLYSASVALFQRLFVAFTGQNSDASIVLSTLILATLFTPIRRSIEAFADRHFKPTTEVESATGSARPAADGAVAELIHEVARLREAVAALAVRMQDLERRGSPTDQRAATKPPEG